MTNSNDSHGEYWFIFQGDRLLMPKANGATSLLAALQISSIQAKLQRQFALGELKNNHVFCAELMIDHPLPNDLDSVPFRQALDLLGSDWYNMATKAYSIIHWDKYHQFCGYCSQPTEHKVGTFERVCTACSHIYYPRISPSVIVLISKGDQILMARSPHFSPGAYGLIAGFVEAGESLEDALHREVKEEVNITIKNVRYFGSQAWPFPDSLMVAFTADYDAGEMIIDHREIESAGWYRHDNLPGRPSSRASLSTKLIEHFLEKHSANKEKNHGTT
jgi:NAD+ diphosphatase